MRKNFIKLRIIKLRVIFNCFFKKSWWRPNKKSRKLLKEEASALVGFDKRVNPSWSKSWKYFIKRQYPWWGLLELNQFKIIEMRDFMENHSQISEEATTRQIKEMTEVIDLGKKILADEYCKPWHEWYDNNTIDVTYIYLKENTEEDNYTTKKPYAEIMGEDFFDEFFIKNENKKATTKLEQWLKDNNLKRKDIRTAYSSKWTNGKTEEENKAFSSKLMMQCLEDKERDISKYYECIGEYSDRWGL